MLPRSAQLNNNSDLKIFQPTILQPCSSIKNMWTCSNPWIAFSQFPPLLLLLPSNSFHFSASGFRCDEVIDAIAVSAAVSL
ncbi:hypothetical protein ACOSP7_000914 [Xanthoceras sorbifolium]